MLSRYTLSCSVLPLSLWFSIWAKNPQNLLVHCWIIDHKLITKEFSERFKLLVVVELQINSILGCLVFYSFTSITSKLVLSHADISRFSSSMVKLLPRWDFIVIDLISIGSGHHKTIAKKPCSPSCKRPAKNGFFCLCESIPLKKQFHKKKI